MATGRIGCEQEETSLENSSEIPRYGSFRNRRTFGKYAKIFRIVLARWISIYSQLRDEKLNEEAEDDDLILPSNEDWRHRVYYRLVELQRECDAELAMKRAGETGLEMEYRKNEMERITTADSKVEEEQRSIWEWEPEIREYPLKVKTRSDSKESRESVVNVCGIAGSMTEACVQPGWRVNDILLAAKVLQRDSTGPAYSDEAEMRRVFGLVYDVLRYKKIFSRALKEVQFWSRNDTLKDRERIVWLLLYDMQGRKFARRGEVTAVEEREKMFEAAGLTSIEQALLKVKTHLAASISRLRIRGSALSLDELLPSRLRIIEGVAWGEEAAIASGWINGNKIASKQQFLEEMSKLKLVHSENGEATELEDTGYVFDAICPKMINLHENAREILAVSSLVREHRFVFLERSLCLGAAALARAIRVGRFCGPIVLTHCLAPRHTGYLAELLGDIEDAGRLLAFGAGERLCEYETYLRDLGVTLQRCRVFSDKYASHTVTAELERATVVLAIPPSSYTGVKDIVDLAVARGGDTDLLESLTNVCVAEDDQDERNIEQPRALLADQMSTLKYALTRPNVQFLIYEAHTVFPSETTEMIRHVVDYVNRIAAEKYVRDHTLKKKAPKEGKESSKSSKPEKSEESVKDDGISTISTNVNVPDSDLFEVGSIDDIYGENVSHMLDPGCFLAVIKRKEMMQFDSLFMIKVAESKGLFGDPKQRRETKREPVPLDPSSRRNSLIDPRKTPKRCKIEIERIMAPTHSSLTRTSNENSLCPRHQRRQACGSSIRAEVRERRKWNERYRGRCRTDSDASSSFGYRSTDGDSGTSKLPYPWNIVTPRLPLIFDNRSTVATGSFRTRDSIKNPFKRRARTSRDMTLSPITLKQELRAIYSLYRTNICSARSKVDASDQRTLALQEQVSPMLSSTLSVERPTGRQLKYANASSTILRSPILARALRRIPLENKIEDSEKEYVDRYSKPGAAEWCPVSRRTLTSASASRLVRPGLRERVRVRGFIEHARLASYRDRRQLKTATARRISSACHHFYQQPSDP
ncbi:uncharacterized protein LOC128894853 [Hylaeus anthracinus]|uniref:uncharacterized protein LOC128894853 n=1 Tax=Hylaeus anthracinus TaxID=313031 RepID=UPI0023BA26C0|nr:uncharacterized protein LOC128894853 [Hylaeus anthracinus]